MEVEVLATQEEINFAPANLVEEVAQNVRPICTTPSTVCRLTAYSGLML